MRAKRTGETQGLKESDGAFAAGVEGQVAAAQREFIKRARLNGLATHGKYDSALEKTAA